MQKCFTWQGSQSPEKGLELDLGPEKLVEYSKMHFVLESSWDFVKSSLKILISL